MDSADNLIVEDMEVRGGVLCFAGSRVSIDNVLASLDKVKSLLTASGAHGRVTLSPEYDDELGPMGIYAARIPLIFANVFDLCRTPRSPVQQSSAPGHDSSAQVVRDLSHMRNTCSGKMSWPGIAGGLVSAAPRRAHRADAEEPRVLAHRSGTVALRAPPVDWWLDDLMEEQEPS
jgi:hypothetical protein